MYDIYLTYLIYVSPHTSSFIIVEKVIATRPTSAQPAGQSVVHLRVDHGCMLFETVL